MSTDTFLTPAEVAELTGIKTGRNKKTREQLQIEWLRLSGIPFWANARGRPIVARVAIEGRASTAEQPRESWKPRVLSTR